MLGEKERNGSGLRIKYRGWGQMNMLFPAPVVQMGIGSRSTRCCGFGSPSGLNVNNNIDNDNVGVAVALPPEVQAIGP